MSLEELKTCGQLLFHHGVKEHLRQTNYSKGNCHAAKAMKVMLTTAQALKSLFILAELVYGRTLDRSALVQYNDQKKP